MLVVTELKSGTTFKEDGNLYQVISYEHIKMGRGSANINGAKVNDVMVTKKEVQYLYQDDENAYFMNPETYDQIALPLKRVDGPQYLKEGESFPVSFLDDEALSVQLPPKMVYKVVDTSPGIRGNSATNVFKDAELENGIKTKVPLFIDIGESIKIDTRTGAYTEKA